MHENHPCVGQASLQMENMDTSLCKGRKENQLDATECFIALIICSTYFGHLYALKVNSICEGNYRGLSMWLSTQQIDY